MLKRALQTLAILGLAITLILLDNVWSHSAFLAARTAPDAPDHAYDSVIRRDVWGVPHVLGRTDAAAAFALAYAHAEDDFPTIEEVMATSRGRLGEITGRDGAAIDYVYHLLDVRADVEARYETDLSAEARAVVEAYADGLNLYAAQHPGELRLPGLFPVTGEDVAAYSTMTLPFFFGLDRTITALVEGEDPPREGADPNERGSNAFAVAPSRSPDGETQLILNSHQPWSGPVAWYEAQATSLEGLDMLGGLFPGAPLPLAGHNRHLGWANTVNRPDLVDVYELVLSEDGESYRFDGRWRPLEKRRVWLRVRMGPFVVPVPQTIRRSVHGPVIVNDRGAFAIRYAGIGEVRAIEQYYRLTKARDFDEWQRAMAMQAIPATNFVYADAEGHIGLFYNARFPARRAGHDWRGVLPGDTSETLWSDYAPYAAFPRLVDPASGFIVNANNSPCFASAAADNLDCGNFSELLGVEAFETNRAIRAIELLSRLEEIGPAALLRVKYDTGVSRRSIMGRYFESLLAIEVRDPGGGRAQALLGRWDWNFDGRGPADSLAVLIARAIWRPAYFGGELPERRETLREAAAFLETHHGRLDPPLGALLRLQRGDADLALHGGPDVLRAIGWEMQAPEQEDGILTADVGDSYILHMIWDAAGRVRSRSVHQFGAATSRPDSPHHDDQAPLFAAQRMKDTLFSQAAIRANTLCRYRPGEVGRRPDGRRCNH